jgi:hypothetical protein
MLLAALRRFVLLTSAVALATAGCALLIGLAAGTSIDRALYLGFYWVGALALIAGVFVGSRGPVRVKSEGPSSNILPLPVPFSTNRVLRWATQSEQEETINNSAVFVAVGLVLLLIGFVVDSRVHVF